MSGKGRSLRGSAGRGAPSGPELIGADLTASECAKLRLTILQEALVRVQSRGAVRRDLSVERRGPDPMTQGLMTWLGQAAVRSVAVRVE
jgi:hypothetical protein